MPTDDRLADHLAAVQLRAEKVKNCPGDAPDALWHTVHRRSADDVPGLLAALDVAMAALARHQHKLSDSRGECCAGCLCDWPCPDTGAVAAALLGEEAGRG